MRNLLIIIIAVLFSAGLALAGTQTIDITDNGFIDWTTDQGATNIHAGNYTAGGGSGSMTTVEEDNVQLGGAARRIINVN